VTLADFFLGFFAVTLAVAVFFAVAVSLAFFFAVALGEKESEGE
jgi:hypothetical protein